MEPKVNIWRKETYEREEYGFKSKEEAKSALDSFIQSLGHEWLVEEEYTYRYHSIHLVNGRKKYAPVEPEEWYYSLAVYRVPEGDLIG